jgi:hypothetical protein
MEGGSFGYRVSLGLLGGDPHRLSLIEKHGESEGRAGGFLRDKGVICLWVHVKSIHFTPFINIVSFTSHTFMEQLLCARYHSSPRDTAMRRTHVAPALGTLNIVMSGFTHSL